MPVVQSLMNSLQSRYGRERGRSIYYAMEAEGSGPFGDGGKYRHLHEEWAAKNGVEPTSKKKPPKPKPRGRSKKRR